MIGWGWVASRHIEWLVRGPTFLSLASVVVVVVMEVEWWRSRVVETDDVAGAGWVMNKGWGRLEARVDVDVHHQALDR